MRKMLFIWTFIVGLSAGTSFTASGQEAIRADRMVVTHASAGQDTVPETRGMEAPEIEAAKRVALIWEEIDNATAGPDRPGDKSGTGPWSFSTSVGTSFISFPRFGSAMNMYAAPQVNFAATERLGFHAGVSVGRTLPVTGLVRDENLVNAGMTNISTYVAASYLLTDNLVIHGSGSRSTFMVPVNGTLQSVHFNDLSIGATYNFGNFSIGATIHHSDAPVFGSPFGNGSSIYGTPFYW